MARPVSLPRRNPLSHNGPSRPLFTSRFVPPSLRLSSRFHFRGPSRPYDKNSPLPPLSLISSIPPSPACSPQPTLPRNATSPSLQTARLAAVLHYPMPASWCSAFLLPAIPLLPFSTLPPVGSRFVAPLLIVSRWVNSSATPISSLATTPARVSTVVL